MRVSVTVTATAAGCVMATRSGGGWAGGGGQLRRAAATAGGRSAAAGGGGRGGQLRVVSIARSFLEHAVWCRAMASHVAADTTWLMRVVIGV